MVRTYVTYEGVDEYGGSFGRHGYNRKYSIKVDLGVIEWKTLNRFTWIGIVTCIGLL
jgi:hypothetical protein